MIQVRSYPLPAIGRKDKRTGVPVIGPVNMAIARAPKISGITWVPVFCIVSLLLVVRQRLLRYLIVLDRPELRSTLRNFSTNSTTIRIVSARAF